MGEVIRIDEYLERRNGPTPEDLRKRLAAIAIDQILLASEKARIQDQLKAMQQ